MSQPMAVQSACCVGGPRNSVIMLTEALDPHKHWSAPCRDALIRQYRKQPGRRLGVVEARRLLAGDVEAIRR